MIYSTGTHDLLRLVTESYLASDPLLPFTCAVSGGSLPALLGAALSSSTCFDWNRWHIFYADERLVELDSQDSNHRATQEAFLSHVSIPQQNVHALNASLIANPQMAAKEYQHEILLHFGNRPVAFDLVLLGLGPDGHTCSLFPGHPLLDETRLLISSLVDSPKMPAARITFTYPLLNAAKFCLFVATGAGKAKILKEIIEDKVDYPATNVKAQRVHWLLDAASASLLTQQ